jgi:Predicted glycosylase
MLAGALLLCGFTIEPVNESSTGEKKEKNWTIGPFVRPEGANPVISPESTSFYCPMRKQQIKWEESDTFNPAATVKDGKIVVLYRAEDNSAQGIGKRTSRIGYAESEDGVTMERLDAPVLFPADDEFATLECPGGCEDPRIAMTEDGLYVMLYTAWNRKKARLSVATSQDLKNWEKHGLAFGKAYNGRFADMFCKSASILTKLAGDRLVIDKVNGKYFMYWGEYAVHAAVSDNLIDWYPVLDENKELRKLAKPRRGHFDSQMTECGPPAIRTKKGIVLLYNGKNAGKYRDKNYPAGAYCAGQLLFDNDDPYKVLERLDKPFFVPEAHFEKNGQYKDGTVFIEGLAYFKKKLYLYYGCADSKVGVAVCDDVKKLRVK